MLVSQGLPPWLIVLFSTHRNIANDPLAFLSAPESNTRRVAGFIEKPLLQSNVQERRTMTSSGSVAASKVQRTPAVRKASLVFGIWIFATSAFAQTPVAIVEEVTGSPAGVSFMDYVRVGQTLQLGPDDKIVLSYLNSCLRETIQGGAVTVGLNQSAGISAHIERVKVDCEAAKMMGAVGQSNDSASLILRGKRARTIQPAPEPEFTLFGLSPLIELRGSGKLVIARLDQTGEYFSLQIEAKTLERGAFLDLASEGKTLTAGGVYGVRWNGHLVVFKVDAGARSGSPLIGRLLRLGLAS
jgi:hypothetical protein